MKSDLSEIAEIERFLKNSLKPLNPESGFSEKLKSRLGVKGEILIERKSILYLPIIIFSFFFTGIIIVFLFRHKLKMNKADQ